MLGELKWRESCSGFRSRRAGLWPASDLPGHCLNSGPACKYSRSGGTLDKKGSASWNFGGPGSLASPPGSKKSCDSQGETNSIVKVKEKPELNFCVQTDDDISLWPGIINEREKSKWKWKSLSCVWLFVTPWTV